ncbi:MAG: hypothetical protein WAW17_13675 [Rhodococcus sp. (in: high G+C Gram-positive bacteria)]|uniref:hypothetical protein n=1 Tax=Rhodococcus sp. TaxID=1831 RepID=UPI003BB00B5A
MTTATATALFLERWFGLMDSDAPDGVLDLITDDFTMSVVFSTGEQASEFTGDRSGLVGYLEQREQGTRIHTVLTAATNGDTELALGEVTRVDNGDFEASFNVTAAIDPVSGLCRRLLICRTPNVRFSNG